MVKLAAAGLSLHDMQSVLQGAQVRFKVRKKLKMKSERIIHHCQRALLKKNNNSKLQYYKNINIYKHTNVKLQYIKF